MKKWIWVLVAFSGWVSAEDIDLFTGNNPAGGNEPTVLVAWHTSANANANVVHGCTYSDGSGAPSMGNTVAGMEQCALVNTVLELKNLPDLLGKVKIGLMVFNKNGIESNYPNGITKGGDDCGYLVLPPKLMHDGLTDPDTGDVTESSAIDAFVTTVKSFQDSTSASILANQSQTGDMVAETWAALNGLSTSCSGTDYSTVTTVSTECRDAVVVYLGNATKETASVKDGTGSPEDVLSAQLKNAFGYAEGSDDYVDFMTPIPVTNLTNSDSVNGGYWADEWTRFMKRVNVSDSAQADRNIATYTIAVYDPDPNLASKIDEEIFFYGKMASMGGGDAYQVEYDDPGKLKEVFIQIFNEVQAVNSVFSSATLPVSANTQGTFLNQIYIAMFRPDGAAGPRWLGNLKQYQLGFDASGTIVLTDATQDPSAGPVTSATNINTGTIKETASSFWTTNTPSNSPDWPTAADEGFGFWVNSRSGSGGTYDMPDGDLVEKGGAGQVTRIQYLTSQDARKIYTCNSETSCPIGSDLPEFSTSNTTLASNADTLFALSSSGAGSASIRAGSSAKMNVTYSCQSEKVKGSTSIYCYFYETVAGTLEDVRAESGTGQNKVAADHVDIIPTDATFLSQTDCNNVSSDAATCEVLETGTNAGLKYIKVKMPSMTAGANNGGNPLEVTVYRYSTTAVVTQNSHGFSTGEQITLSSCAISTSETVNSGSGVGLSQMTGGSFVTEAKTILTANSYSIELNSVALGSHDVTCRGETLLTGSNLIDWVRGEDIAGNEALEGPCPLNNDGSRNYPDGTTACSISIRPSVHGDVLHSRPAVINFGDINNDNPEGETDVIVFYGANDGLYRAVNGNQTRSITLDGGRVVPPGGELWAFIAPEFFTKLPRLFNDDPKINYTGVVDDEAEPRDYFFDGITAILQDKRTTGATAGKSYIYLTARRGGPILYALDVTDPKLPPKILWKVNKTQIPELAQTWSHPKVVEIKGHANPVLIFAAGYDADVEDCEPAGQCEDSNGNPVTVTTDEGRGIIILDATDGSLVWAALADCTGVAGATSSNCFDNSDFTTDFDKSFAADVTVVDRNFDGVADRLYAADVGGGIWRVDLEPNGYSTTPSPSDFQVMKIADISGSGNDARKFLFPPDVVPTNNFDAVVAVSGDREHPLYPSPDDVNTAGIAYNVTNRFYMIKDTVSYNGDPSRTVANEQARTVLTESDLFNRTDGRCLDATNSPVACTYDSSTGTYKDSSGTEVTLVDFDGNGDLFDGYYFSFGNPGEKGINAPVVVAGSVFFATNQPDAVPEDSCTANLGVARGYKVNFLTGEKTINVFVGGGMPPSPIAGLVTIGDETVPFIIGGEGPSAFDPSTPTLNLDPGRKRTYWYYK
ncbi:Tfp pilus tip-associated adhesin PilY1 [Litorivivens lipolytica]|uniref:Tfp pilus tip-associated adhesin PilY1 n=1 Tax=Litorivivens lipolytica TaxID=1524264 RepID=A0A7W4Z703_9GAMM|nr:PilC/PilY family type IV pilus protein [Litorivivens lipolytica]MBB3047510.1 Tfp pilus tip-associated adhesin PilY1 [Litorivivens lipolytica]